MPSPQSQPEHRRSSISVPTLIIASVSSVVAALVVSRIWGPGTLVGAAATPVIVTLVSEALRKPAEVITVVRTPTGTQVHEPAQPRRREVGADALQAGDTVVATPAPVARSRRPAVVVAAVTGLVAAVIGIFLLTSGELVFGDAVAGSGGRTSLGIGSPGSSRPRTPTGPAATPTTSTETRTTTTTVPATPTAPPESTTTEPGTTPAPPAAGATGATGATGP